MKRVVLAACVALATVAAALSTVGRDARAADGLVVVRTTPSRNQPVLPDLSDPGLNGVLTVRFSSPIDPDGVVEDDGTLGRKCTLRDHRFISYSASAAVRRNVLTISPVGVSSPVLRQGRYTLTLDSSIRSADGAPLNGGRRDFSTTFRVGSGPFEPVLRRVSTAPGTRVGLRRAVTVTFDERIDPASAAAAVRFENRSTTPPTPIPTILRFTRDGFGVIARPDRVAGYPAETDVSLVVAGRGTSTPESAVVLAGETGLEFTRDAGDRWTPDADEPTLFHSRLGDFDDETGEFVLTFRTRAAPRRGR
jgi:hypothetical protein